MVDQPQCRRRPESVIYEELDFEKNLSKWKKPELEAYLSHHKIAKSGNSLGVSPITCTLLQLSNNDFSFIVLLIYVGRRHLYSLVVSTCMYVVMANEQLLYV